MTREERSAIHALFVRFADGERAAFDPLFAALWPILRAFVARSLPESEVEDVAQEAVVKVFARIEQYDDRRDGLAWALTIASFEVLSARKRIARRREAAIEPEVMSSSTSPEMEASHRELLEALERYLGHIDEIDRVAIEAELRGAIARGERDRKRRWRALDRLRRFWRTSHG
jgi:RNA polymerase sigma factor (sigma-70 family)